MPGILAAIGTPTQPPKTRGKSPVANKLSLANVESHTLQLNKVQKILSLGGREQPNS